MEDTLTDTDATRGRRHVADPLREFVQAYASSTYNETHKLTFGEYEAKLLEIADQIDREHERRMEQQSYELRKAFCRYMGGVLDDYRHGMKRKRLRK